VVRGGVGRGGVRGVYIAVVRVVVSKWLLVLYDVNSRITAQVRMRDANMLFLPI